MSDNVISLDGGGPPKAAAVPRPDLIAFLEDMLAQAKSGHLQQVAAVFMDHTGFVGDGHSPVVERHELIPIIGGLEVCKHTLLQLAGFWKETE